MSILVHARALSVVMVAGAECVHQGHLLRKHHLLMVVIGIDGVEAMVGGAQHRVTPDLVEVIHVRHRVSVVDVGVHIDGSAHSGLVQVGVVDTIEVSAGHLVFLYTIVIFLSCERST